MYRILVGCMAIDFLHLELFANSYPSQKHHLKEIVAAYDKRRDNFIGMFDDGHLLEK